MDYKCDVLHAYVKAVDECLNVNQSQNSVKYVTLFCMQYNDILSLKYEHVMSFINENNPQNFQDSQDHKYSYYTVYVHFHVCYIIFAHGSPLFMQHLIYLSKCCFFALSTQPFCGWCRVVNQMDLKYIQTILREIGAVSVAMEAMHLFWCVLYHNLIESNDKGNDQMAFTISQQQITNIVHDSVVNTLLTFSIIIIQ